MSLSTLLEAAEYLEAQEQQQRAAAKAAASKPTTTTTTTTTQQTVLITTSQLAPSLLTLAQPVVKRESPADQQPIVSSSTANNIPAPPRRVLHNSFDIINPLVIDEASGATEIKRKQPPMVFRSGTREVHNKLEKHRRAHLKECFDILKKQLPATQDEKKTSNLSILHSALRFIQTLKRKERELEHEMERLARQKIVLQQKYRSFKKEPLTLSMNSMELLNKILPETAPPMQVLEEDIKIEPTELQDPINGDRIQIPILPNNKTAQIAIATTQVKQEVGASSAQPQQSVPATTLSVVPVGYQMPQGLVLQKLAIVPKGLTDHLTPIVSTHFITQQQLTNAKVVMNAQYVMKPVVVVSRPS